MNRFKTTSIRLALAAVLVSFVAASAAAPKLKEKHFRAKLDGDQEVPTILTTGHGNFEAKLNKDGTALTYELSFSNLEGGNAIAAHVHIGAPATSGGVMFFLCGGGGKPACPAGGGTVTGTVVAADILAVMAQGIAAGEFDDAMQAMVDGLTYANVHTTTYPGGEIRGLVKK